MDVVSLTALEEGRAGPASLSLVFGNVVVLGKPREQGYPSRRVV